MKFEVGDLVKVIKVTNRDRQNKLTLGSSGYVVDCDDNYVSVNFVDNNYHSNRCLMKRDEASNIFYHYTLGIDSVSLVEKTSESYWRENVI